MRKEKDRNEATWYLIFRTVAQIVYCIKSEETVKLAYVPNIRIIVMSDKALVKVHFVPFVMIPFWNYSAWSCV